MNAILEKYRKRINCIFVFLYDTIHYWFSSNFTPIVYVSVYKSVVYLRVSFAGEWIFCDWSCSLSPNRRGTLANDTLTSKLDLLLVDNKVVI